VRERNAQAVKYVLKRSLQHRFKQQIEDVDVIFGGSKLWVNVLVRSAEESVQKIASYVHERLLVDISCDVEVHEDSASRNAWYHSVLSRFSGGYVGPGIFSSDFFNRRTSNP
jgi:hypothetical protein